jgi:hypothetical protein
MDVRKPTRTAHSYPQVLAGPPDQVFPLLCPVREREWVPGWDPSLVLSNSGVAEDGCVFITPDDDGPAATWVVTDYQPPRRIAFVKLTPGELVTRIAIDLEPGDDPDGRPGGTRARVAYEYTALGPQGEAFVEGCDEAWYREFMEAWEGVLNRYLREGSGD